jgi:murein DD-endopeptidase MepM/ murein hydrolase activator NlpD
MKFKTKTSISVVCCTAVALVGLAVPAHAATLAQMKQRQAAARSRKASLAAQVDTLRASDADLQKALDSLDAQVRSQQALVDDATQAVESAKAKLADTQAKLDATTARINKLRDAMVRRAVDAYADVSNGSDPLGQLAGTSDMNDAARKNAVLDGITQTDSDVADSLRAAKQDQQRLRDLEEADRKNAEAHQAQLIGALNAVKSDRDQKSKVQDAVNKRISDIQNEEKAAAAEESQLGGSLSRGDANVARPPSAFGLIRPIGGPITSPFGMRWGHLHPGIDFGVPIGTPIHAAKAGTVVFSGSMSGYGNAVVIDHGGGFSTLYGHQSRTAVSVGQHVNQGDVIGYSGNTGFSTGPHLHFETRVNGSPQDPMRFL